MVKALVGSEIREWMVFALYLLVQTVIVAGFIIYMRADLDWVKQATIESKADRATLHAETSDLGTINYRLSTLQADIASLRNELAQHMREK